MVDSPSLLKLFACPSDSFDSPTDGMEFYVADGFFRLVAEPSGKKRVGHRIEGVAAEGRLGEEAVVDEVIAHVGSSAVYRQGGADDGRAEFQELMSGIQALTDVSPFR